MKYQINIQAGGGYAAGQVKSVTVAEIREMLADLEDDDEIVTYDVGNMRGAAYGYFTLNLDEALEQDEE